MHHLSAEAFIDHWHGSSEGRVKVHLTAHAPDTCSPDFLTRIALLARHNGLKIGTHLAQSQDEVDWVEAR